jgi:hypothetical protein
MCLNSKLCDDHVNDDIINCVNIISSNETWTLNSKVEFVQCPLCPLQKYLGICNKFFYLNIDQLLMYVVFFLPGIGQDIHPRANKRMNKGTTDGYLELLAVFLSAVVPFIRAVNVCRIFLSWDCQGLVRGWIQDCPLYSTGMAARSGELF